MAEYKETCEDFNLRWSNTFVLFEDRVTYICGAYYPDEENKETKEEWFVQIEVKGKREKRSDLDSSMLQPLMFDSKFFNDFSSTETNPACLHFSRTPRRQNKRSICADNTLIITPLLPLLQKIRNRNPGHYNLNGSYVDLLLAHKYPDYQHALSLCSQHLIVAVSPSLAVALSSISPDRFLLVSPFGFIGEATEDTLFVRHPGARQEVLDFVNRNSLNLQVINA